MREDDIAQAANITQIFLLLDKFNSTREGMVEEALAWAYAALRQDGSDIEWARRGGGDGGTGRLFRHVQKLTGCDPGLVASIGTAVLQPSRVSLVLDALREFDLLYPNGGAPADNSRIGRRPIPTFDSQPEEWILADE